MDNLGGGNSNRPTIPLARDNLPGLVSNLASNGTNKFQGKISGTGGVIAQIGFTLFISNGDMIIIIIKSLEDSSVLIDAVTETVKHEIKKEESRLLGALLPPLAASLAQPVIFSVVKDICGRGVRRAGRGYIYIKIVSSAPSVKQYQDY